jgi:hypothetical protein
MLENCMHYGFTHKKPGQCWSLPNSEVFQSFALPGDSGSIILHAGSGTQLGLVFGTSSSGNALYIPLDPVFQDIFRVTSKKVKDPVFVSKWAIGSDEKVQN